jgi:hypothetical protein
MRANFTVHFHCTPSSSARASTVRHRLNRDPIVPLTFHVSYLIKDSEAPLVHSDYSKTPNFYHNVRQSGTTCTWKGGGGRLGISSTPCIAADTEVRLASCAAKS